MNDELRDIFIEQIAQNIEQVKEEMKSDRNISEDNQQEQISTAIDNTPPPKAFSKSPFQSFKDGMHNIQNRFKSIEYDQHDVFQSNRFTNNNSDKYDSDSIDK